MQALKPYLGPLNPFAKDNLYMFLLYEQTTLDMTLPKEVSDVLLAPSGVTRATFKLGDLTAIAALTGMCIASTPSTIVYPSPGHPVNENWFGLN